MQKNDSILFSQGHIGKLTIKNRYIVAPMTRISADEDGKANARMKTYYERFAKGGFGAVITEGIYFDDQYSQGYFNQPGIESEEHIQAWKHIVQSVQTQGTIIIAQLMHAGGQSQGNRFQDETIAPSAVAPKGEQLSFYNGSGPFQTPKAMTQQDITQVKNAFVHAATSAQKAGFDGVEIHGANGYLLDQFLTDYLNKREDRYGGSIEKGLTFMTEIIEAVREKVGEDFIVGIRISQGKVADSTYKWPGGEKTAQSVFSILGKTSLSYIHVTENDATAPGFEDGSKTFTQVAKEYSLLPVIANGGLGDLVKASHLLENKYADFVSIGTSALANPDLPNRILYAEKLNDFNPNEILMPIAKIKDSELAAEVLSHK